MAVEDLSFTQRMMIFVGISLPLIVGWNIAFPPPPPAEVPAEAGATTGGEETPAPAPEAAADAPPAEVVAAGSRTAPARPFERVDARLEGPLLALDVSNVGHGLISNIDLLDPQFLAPDGSIADRFTLADDRSLELSFEGDDNEIQIDDLPQHVTTADATTYAVEQSDASVRVTQSLSLTEGYEATYVVTVTNRAPTAKIHQLHLTSRQGDDGESGRFDVHRMLCAQGEDVEALAKENFSEGGGCNPFGGGDDGALGPPQRIGGATEWSGVSSNFFAQLTVPDGFEGSGCVMAVADNRTQASTFVGPKTTLDPGATKTYRFGLFLGPKFEERLLGFQAVKGASVQRAIDWGWFGSLTEVLGGWMLNLLRWFHSLTGIWGLAIILLTFLVRFAMLPLTLKQLNSMKAMKEIQPELSALKEKYKDDKQKQHQEMQALMTRSGASPLTGCLPMLLQFPIFIALYASLQAAVELYNVPFLWVPNLVESDPYFLLPLGMGAVMYLQTKLQPTPADNEQAKMMQTLMPVIFTAFMWFLPAGLTVYIFASTVIGVIQTLVIVRPRAKADAAKDSAS